MEHTGSARPSIQEAGFSAAKKVAQREFVPPLKVWCIGHMRSCLEPFSRVWRSQVPSENLHIGRSLLVLRDPQGLCLAHKDHKAGCSGCHTFREARCMQIRCCGYKGVKTLLHVTDGPVM